jgi:hypothetical protein
MPSPLARQIGRSWFARLSLHQRRPSLCNRQVGSCHCFFGACSAFTHVMACTLAESPCDPLPRKLRQLRCLRCRFDCFYEKVIEVKADVAALLCLISAFVTFGTSVTFGASGPSPSVSLVFAFLVLCGFRHISTEKFALGSLRSDDWQLGRQHSPFCLSSRETLLVFFRAA